MTDRELLEEVLKVVKSHGEELHGLKVGQQVLSEEVQGLKAGQQVLSEKVQGLNEDIRGLKVGQQVLNEEVQGLKVGQQVLGEDVQGIKVQLDETNQIVKAIRHHQEHISAKVEGLEATTAKADALRGLDNKYEVLNSRLFAQEVEMQELRRVK